MNYIALIEAMIDRGQPPIEACTQFGVGYEDAFERLKNTYLQRFFSRGQSAEKFIIGPYGSGKTHFLRQMLEVSEANNCVTAEIQLSKNIEIDNTLIIYKEIAREIKVPGKNPKGIKNLLQASIEKIRQQYPDKAMQEEVIGHWLDNIDQQTFENDIFRRVLLMTLKAIIKGDRENLEDGASWLSGDVANRSLCRALGVNPIAAKEQNTFGRRATFSLCQYIRISGFVGTVIGYDEAEQALNVSNKLRQRILSMARSEIDAVSRLQNASLLVLYAFTPDVVQEMKNYPALQQRIAEPDPARRFFDGNDYSPVIDLAQPYQNAESSLAMLEKIGYRLVKLFYEHSEKTLPLSIEELNEKIKSWAKQVYDNEASIRNRRDMVKLTCSRLMYLYNHGIIDEKQVIPPVLPVDDEV